MVEFSYSPTIYLAGTIYKNKKDCNWKNVFMNYLKPYEFSFIDPSPMMGNSGQQYVARDKACIDRCDILVAYIQRPSFGTTMEIFYSHSKQNKEVYIINPNGKYKDDMWLSYHSHSYHRIVEVCAETIRKTYASAKKYSENRDWV